MDFKSGLLPGGFGKAFPPGIGLSFSIFKKVRIGVSNRQATILFLLVTTTKPLIIEYPGAPAGKYGALVAELFVYDASNLSSAFRRENN